MLVVNGLKECIQPYHALVVKLRTCFGPLIIGSGYFCVMFCCLGSKVADIVFPWGTRRTSIVWVIPKCIQKEPWRCSFCGLNGALLGVLLRHAWCGLVLYVFFYIILAILSKLYLFGNRREWKNKRQPSAMLGEEVQMKWVSNENALLCSLCPNVQRTAQPESHSCPCAFN